MYANKKWYASRKLWAAIITAAVVVGNEAFGWELTAEAVIPAVFAVVAYITGQAFVDVQTVKQEGIAFTRIKSAEAEVFVHQNLYGANTSPQAGEVGFTPEVVE